MAARAQAKRAADLDALYAEIAGRLLGFATLDERRMDAADFKEVSVWGVRDALEAAYRAGLAAGARKGAR